MTSTTSDIDNSNNAGGNSNTSSCICVIVRDFVVVLLLILFFYGASVQSNDAGAVIMWIIFYICHGLINLLALFGYHLAVVQQQRMYLPTMLKVSLTMVLWSTILLIIVSIQLSKVTDDGIDVGGDNPDNWSEREEKAYELAGVTLGFISSSCHACYFFKKPSASPVQQSDNDNNNQDKGAATAADLEDAAGVS